MISQFVMCLPRVLLLKTRTYPMKKTPVNQARESPANVTKPPQGRSTWKRYAGVSAVARTSGAPTALRRRCQRPRDRDRGSGPRLWHAAAPRCPGWHNVLLSHRMGESTGARRPTSQASEHSAFASPGDWLQDAWTPRISRSASWATRGHTERRPPNAPSGPLTAKGLIPACNMVELPAMPQRARVQRRQPVGSGPCLSKSRRLWLRRSCPSVPGEATKGRLVMSSS